MYIVDRIEEGYVILENEDKSMQDIPLEMFPEEIKAGDVVFLDGESYSIDKEATKERSKKIKSMMDQLWED